MIVIDASVLANAVGDEAADGRQARELVREEGELAAPDLVDVETTAVLRRRWLAGAITDARFDKPWQTSPISHSPGSPPKG